MVNKNKKRIVFILAQLVSGGAEKVTMNIMSLLDKELFDIHLIVMDKNGPSLGLIPEKITLHDLNVSKTIFSVLKLRNKITQLDPDMIFSTLIRTHIALGLSLIGLNHDKKPIIIMRSPNSPKLLLENKQLNFVKRFLLEFAYKQCDYIFAQTPEMKEEIHLHHKIAKDKIKVFLNPVNINDIEKKLMNISSPFENDNHIHVVASGRLTKQKGFDFLIKSFKNVTEKNKNFKLYIIGEDNGEKINLQNLINFYGLENNIKFLGYQDNPYRFYYYADLFVLSSRWEGLPNTILENLYLRKPIIATKCIPFMTELIQDGVNGILVEVDNIEEMSEAILNYKKLHPSPSKHIHNKENLNNYFLFYLSEKECLK
ncbi:glycosyltransferase [Hydrogenimonas sp.]